MLLRNVIYLCSKFQVLSFKVVEVVVLAVIFKFDLDKINVKYFSAVFLSSYVPSFKSWISYGSGRFFLILTLRYYINVKVKRIIAIYLFVISSMFVLIFKYFKVMISAVFSVTLRQYIKVKVIFFQCYATLLNVIYLCFKFTVLIFKGVEVMVSIWACFKFDLEIVQLG